MQKFYDLIGIQTTNWDQSQSVMIEEWNKSKVIYHENYFYCFTIAIASGFRKFNIFFFLYGKLIIPVTSFHL